MWTRSKGRIPSDIQKTQVNGKLDNCKDAVDSGEIVTCDSRKKRLKGQTSQRESTSSTGQELEQLPRPGPRAKTRLQVTGGRQNNQDNSITIYVPAHTIPEEAWLKIFGLLDSSDLNSCFRTCSNWKKRIMGKRAWLPTVLFPEVAPLLLDKLPKLDFLECRKVCQVWKKGMDHAYQTHPQHIRLGWEAAAKEANSRLPELVNDFSSPEKIQRFLNDMELHRGNPFVGRAISLNCEDPFLPNGMRTYHFGSGYWNHVIQLLDVFGPQVHFAVIELPCCDHIAKAFHLRNCLLRLPNLRRLKISIECGGSTSYENQVQDFVSANPMPLLADLETLEIEEGARDFTNEILNSCCAPAKIKRLDLGAHWGFCDALYHFSNLEVIKSTFDMERFEAFRNLSRVPPLREVDLRFGYAEYARVFKSLELFGDSLINAKINGFFSHTNRIISLQLYNYYLDTNPKINLPKLKRFVLVHYNGPLDPFLGLHSLEHLEFDLHANTVWIREFIERNESMLHSKVWTLMPSLKKILVRLRGSCQTRYDRNSFLENNTGSP